jgi:hypothetical protein
LKEHFLAARVMLSDESPCDEQSQIGKFQCLMRLEHALHAVILYQKFSPKS